MLGCSAESFDQALTVEKLADRIEAKVNDAQGLKDHERKLRPEEISPVELEMVESSVKLRVNEQVWETYGLKMDDFLRRIIPRT